MSMETTMLYLYVETPLHAGVGSGLSSIDLPIQRERPTQYPMIQGSGIKGKLRATAEELAKREQSPFTEDLVYIIFGPKNGNEYAGALVAGDARILLFPVRSLKGVFAYVTSYDVLNRFMRDMQRGKNPAAWQLPEEKQDEHTAHVTGPSQVAVSDNVVLEEFSFKAEAKPVVNEIAEWLANNAFPQKRLPQTNEYAYWREKVKNSLVILPEDDFRDFVVNATEIVTRISIDRDTKTAAGKALWTEEHLPADALLYVPIYATDARKIKQDGDKKVPEMLASQILDATIQLENGQGGYMQLGGDETVGRGIVRMHWGSNRRKENSRDAATK